MRKQFDPGLVLAMTQSGCVAAMKQKFWRWISGMQYHEDRTKDFGFADAYKDWKGFSGGSPEACAAMDKDPFFVSKMLDSVLEGNNSKMSFYYELQRLLTPFTYDPANIKCKAYIYHGELDGEAKLSQAEQHHTKLKDSVPNLTPISQPNDQTLEGSFSSVSAPNFARKYSLESS